VILKNILKLCLAALIISCYIIQTPVKAAEIHTGDPFAIKLAVGSDQMLLNETSLSMEKPYLSGGTTMVPLKVFTAGFGAIVSWDAKTQTVGLLLGTHNIQLTIGNKQAVVNGKPVKIPTAAEIHNDKVMLPLRLVTEALGAKVSLDPVQKQLIISGSVIMNETAAASLNVDAGKSKIGDSFYNWSMKYPTNLMKSSQSDSGDSVSFDDTNGEYSLSINIEESDVQNLSADGLLLKLDNYAEQTILNKTTATDVNGAYAQILSKGSDGDYSETRAYFNQGKIYYITLDIALESNYKNPLKYVIYEELLNSFLLSFDTTDLAIKDLSLIKDGYRDFTNDDFGFKLRIPAGWNQGTESSPHFDFYSDNLGTESLYISVSSISTGDTLDGWIARDDSDFDQTFVAAYGTRGTATPITVGGFAAKENLYSQNLDGTWSTDDSIYIMNGKLKYNIDLVYPKDTPADAIKAEKDDFISSFSFTNTTNPAIGFIADDKGDQSKLSNISNKKLGITLDLPEFWSNANDSGGQDASIAYDFLGGHFSILASDVATADIIKKLESTISSTDSMKLVSSADAAIIGITARKIVYQDTTSDVPTTTTAYIFSNNGKNYVLIYGISDAVATPATLQKIEAVIASIKFTP